MRVREIAAHKRSVGLLCTGIAKPRGRARAKAKGQPKAAGGGEQASPVTRSKLKGGLWYGVLELCVEGY